MWRRAWRSVAAERQRWGGLVLAVVVSVAFVTATLSLGALTRSTLDGALDGRFAAVDVALRRTGGQTLAPGSSFRPATDPSTLDAVRSIPGVGAVAGVVETSATVIGRDGDPVPELFGAGTTGTNWIDGELGGARIVSGRSPRAANEVVLDRDTAKAAGVAVGDALTVDLPTSSLRAGVVGVAGIVSGGRIVAGPRMVWMDLDALQSVRDGAPGFDLVIASADDDTTAAEVAAAIDAELGASGLGDEYEAVTGAELVEERQTRVRYLAEFFDRPLLASAGIAVFVGAFVIFNTFSIVVAQRVREMAVLRAVGATVGQVTRTVLAEAIVVGAVGSLLGVALGWLVAAGTRDAFSAALDLPDGPLEVTWSIALVAAGTGVVSTLLACAVPARRAGATPPVTVLRGIAVDDSHRWTVRHTAGVVLLVGAVALIVVVLTGTAELGLAAIGLGCASVFVAFALVGSAVVGPVFTALGRPLVGVRGLTARLAVRSASRSPGRTTMVVVALSIGIAMVTVITTFEASIRASTEDRATGQLGGVDLLVESPVGVPRSVAPAVEGVAGIDSVTPVRLAVMTVRNSFDGRRYRREALAAGAQESPELPPLGAGKFLTGIDLAAARTMMDLPDLDPPIRDLADDEVMVLSATAERAGWEVGDPVEVWFSTTGYRTLRLAATFDTTFGAGSEYVANLETTGSNAPAEFAGDSMVWAKARDGVDLAAFRQRAEDTVHELAPAARIVSIGQYLEQQMAGTSSLLNLLVVQVGVSVLVAWLGVANTVAMALRERQTETTRLRAMGSTRAQFHETVVWETLLVALCGSALGVATGWAMGAGFIESFGQEGLDPVIAVRSVAVIAGAGAVAAVLTALVQARRVSGPVLPTGR